ncbi:Murein DD-endopeptidase MepH precursor [compost metagenome]
MSRHRRSLLLLLMLGYQTSALASPAHHARHPPVPAHHRKTKSVRRTARPHRIPAPSPRTRVVNTLMAQLGKPYRWGGTSPETGFDCSGLVWYAWQKDFNVRLPRTAEGMYAMSQAHPVQFQHLEPGDMVFFSMEGEKVDHVGVYVGNGHFIEAPHTGENVKIVSLEKENYRRHYLGARRLLTPEQISS